MHITAGILIALLISLANQSTQQPEWCRSLPRAEYRKLERVTVADKWFEVYRIRPGVFAIYEPHQQEEVISYLILGKKRAVLFDTGMGISNIKKLVEGLTDLPVSVLNSHTHNDHVGDNWRFSDIYGMDTAFTRENANGSTADAKAEITPDAICGTLPAGFDAKTYATRPFHITHWLHGGEKIDLGGRVLEVISTPGHTPDSISLWDAQNRLLFTGDMYYPGPIFLYRPETDLDAYVVSIKKMNALGAKLLLPAHNVPVADPADLPRVLAAMEQVSSGKIKPAKVGGKVEYKFQGFSFLMR
ncbi:MAG TPA: MBL fold metallo-hydrolase [Candidatus Angelobacter sp.]|nr:MBL fold metallo-hydrolase [Candidatus Angelobacter sp.]